MLKRIIAIVSSMLITTAAFAGDVTGAGSSFFFPIAAKWTDGYKKQTGININYQSIGSSAGIKQVDSKTVTFGATDIPITPEELNKKNQVQFPVIVGGIVLIVNLKEVSSITLTTDVVAKIYMDKIRRWNDKEIADLNPNVNLPNMPIVKVRRSDGSGTTWNFTKFLSEANTDWDKNFGTGASIEWAGNAVGAKGNEGVASNVAQTNGSIGYVEYAFAKQNKLTAADMIGTDGKKVVAGLAAFQSTWPMIATTYVVMYKNPDDKNASKEALKFFEYTFEHDVDAAALDYVPLTSAQKESVKKIWLDIK